MSADRMTEGQFKDFMGREVVFPENSFVKAEEELLPLCSMCKNSRLTCENIYIREVFIPTNEGEEGTVAQMRQDDGTYKEVWLAMKSADGVEAGIYKSEEDIPVPFICEWFDLKDLG